MKYVDVLKKIRISEVIYAIMFALMCIFSRHVVCEPAARSTILTTYFTDIRAVDILLFAIFAVLTYAVLQGIKWLISRISSNWLYSDKATDSRTLIVTWIVIFALTTLAWIPYLMSYWPGGIYNDTLDSIHIALGESGLSNQNTILYMLFWKLTFWVGQIADQGVYGGLKLMTILQPAIMIAVSAYFFTWLRKNNVKTYIVVLGSVIFALMPVFPFYGISLWKDTLFGINIFLYSFLLYVIVKEAVSNKSDGVTVISLKRIIEYIFLSLLIMFGRNNGIYVIIISALALVLFIKNIFGKKEFIRFATLNVVLVVLYFIITGPVYSTCGIKQSNPVEKYGIPLQQVAYMVTAGANMSPEEQEVINSIVPMDGWINLYDPECVDTIKFDPLFNAGYFNTHTGEFIKAYIGMTVKNPFLAIKGYMLATIGFWDAFKSSSSAYICNVHCYGAEFFMSDYFVGKAGKPLSEIVGPRRYISSGALVWIMLTGLILVLSMTKKGNRSLVVPFAPTVALWMTYLIATPLAFSFRYLFSVLLCIPLYLMCIMRSVNKGGA